MTFNYTASLHLDNIIALYVMIFYEFLYIYQISSSFGRYGDLSVISKLRIHLSLKVNNKLLPKTTIDNSSFIV